MISASPYLDITTLYKKVEKSVCKFRSKGSNQPRVEECYVGDLRRTGRKGILSKKLCSHPKHCKDEAAEKEGKVGGRMDWWQKIKLIHLRNMFDNWLNYCF